MINKWAIQAWFEIHNGIIDEKFLSNIYYTLHELDELKDSIYKIYFSSVTYDKQTYQVGKKFLVTPNTSVVEFVVHIQNALNKLEDKAYPIAAFEVFIIKIKKIDHE